MPKARKRKVPITSPDSADASSSNPHASRTLIRQFHVLLKRQAQLQRSLGLGPGLNTAPHLGSPSRLGSTNSRLASPSRVDAGSGPAGAQGRRASLSSSSSVPAAAAGAAASLRTTQERAARERELAEVESAIERLGGLGAYQRMSSIGQGSDRGGGSEKVLVAWLREMRVPECCRNANARRRLLEVGALKPDNYAPHASWIAATPMDLRARHPSILEQDFLQMDAAAHRGRWDIISLSLVVNFVPQPKDRGRMLQLAQTMLSESGLLFLALPLPCLTNSRYLTFEHLERLMAAVGFCEIKSRWKEGGKMAYWLYEKNKTCAPAPHSNANSNANPNANSNSNAKKNTYGQFHKKEELRSGKARNNFCILL